MSDTPIAWIGGEHRFRLGIGEWRKLQDSCDAGPEEVLNRLRFGTWRVNDLIEPIRLGLIGSGEMTTAEAGPFVTGLWDQHNPVDFKLTALAILAEGLFGPEDDPVGKEAGAETESPENGDSAKSTETVP